MTNFLLLRFIHSWLFLLIATSSMCYANDQWQLVKQNTDDDIMIYYCQLNSGMTKFKGVTKIKSTLNSFIALINDFDNIPNWVTSIRKVSIIKKNSQKDGYIYTINKMPWPLKDRDSIVYSRIEQDPKTHVITISGKGEPKYIPPNSHYVRISKIESFWKLTPITDNYIEVEFQGYGDPGGNISSFVFKRLYKFFLWRLPYYTLKNMKKMIHYPKYQQQKFDYISEGVNVHPS